MDHTIKFADGRIESFPTKAEAERFALYWMIHHKDAITMKSGDDVVTYSHVSPAPESR